MHDLFAFVFNVPYIVVSLNLPTLIVSHVAIVTCISLQVGEQYQMELWEEGGNKEPRYTLTVVDVPHRFAKNGQFAIFIAPQGR